MNIWLGMVLSLVIALAIGFLNGYMVVKSGSAELHRHARARSSSSAGSTCG